MGGREQRGDDDSSREMHRDAVSPAGMFLCTGSLMDCGVHPNDRHIGARSQGGCLSVAPPGRPSFNWHWNLVERVGVINWLLFAFLQKGCGNVFEGRAPLPLWHKINLWQLRSPP